MKKNEIIKLLKPKCNGYDLPLSLNIEIIAEILVNKQEDEQLTLTDVVKHYSEEDVEKAYDRGHENGYRKRIMVNKRML